MSIDITKATRQYTYTLLQANAIIPTKTCCFKKQRDIVKILHFCLLKPQKDNLSVKIFDKKV